MKYEINDVVGGFQLLERLPKHYVKVRCLKCSRVYERQQAFLSDAPTSCRACSGAPNRKYKQGQDLGGWIINSPGPVEHSKWLVTCKGCGKGFVRDPSIIKTQRGCKTCFPDTPMSEEGRKRANQALRISNKKISESKQEFYKGKIYAFLQVVETDGIYFVCKCLGDGEGHDNGTFKKLRSDVTLGKTTSCGCMRADKFKESYLKHYGVESPMDNPEHLAKVQEGMMRCLKDGGSKPELEIREFIRSLGFPEVGHEYITHENEIHEIDIGVKSLKLGIEYNGFYWHGEAHLGSDAKQYHNRKTKACAAHGVRLIHVFEHDWRDKQPQVKAFLKSVLGKNEFSVGARECEIKRLDWDTAAAFHEEHHLQGKPHGGMLHIGVYYSNVLLAVASFGRHHRVNDPDLAVLSRWCCRANWNVAGGFSRALSMAKPLLKAMKVKRLATWADLRWSTGNCYLASGWKDVTSKADEEPQYFYVDNNTKKVFSKQSRKKDLANTPEEMTEHEHALTDGLYRVYDCGRRRFELELD